MGVTVPDKGKSLSEVDNSIRSVSFLTGCALLFQVEIFQKIGYFDSSYFFYSEDVDFGLRIKSAGFNMYFVPDAKAWHKIDDIAIDRTTPNVLYNLGRSSIILLRKNFSGIELYYGIFLRFTIYTLFRFYQIIKGKRGWDSAYSWLKGLFHGISARINEWAI
jgi:GT2 family glycosyltransferase